MKNLKNLESFSIENSQLKQIQGGWIRTAWRIISELFTAYEVGSAVVDAHQYMNKNFGNPPELRGVK